MNPIRRVTASSKSTRKTQQSKTSVSATTPASPSVSPSSIPEIIAAAVSLENKRDSINRKMLKYHQLLLERRDAIRQRKAQAKAAHARDTAKSAAIKRQLLECDARKDILRNQLEKELGTERFAALMRSRGSDKKTRPILPAAMKDVSGSAMKQYIDHPQLKKKGRLASGRGGQGDVVPESAEIGTGGM